MPGEDSFSLANSPGQLLHRAQQIAAENFSHANNGGALTQRQFVLLHAVKDGHGDSQIALAKATGIDRSTLAELIVRLSQKGFLRRQPAVHDRRVKCVTLTEAGMAQYVAALAAASTADIAILNALPKKQRDNFLKVLGKLIKASQPTDSKADKKKKRGKNRDVKPQY